MNEQYKKISQSKHFPFFFGQFVLEFNSIEDVSKSIYNMFLSYSKSFLDDLLSIKSILSNELSSFMKVDDCNNYSFKKSILNICCEQYGFHSLFGKSNSIMHQLFSKGSDLYSITEKHDLLSYFIDKGYDINTIDEEGNTLLHIASKYGISSLFDFLISQANINLNCINNQHMNIGHILSIEGHSELLKKVINDIHVIRDENGYEPIHYSVIHEKINIFNILLSSTSFVMPIDTSEDKSVFYLGIKTKNYIIIGSILEYYRSKNLHYHQIGQHFIWEVLSEHPIIDVSKYFDINTLSNMYRFDSSRLIKLMVSCIKNNNIKMVEFLISNESFLNCQDEDKNTPLHHAAMLNKDNIVILLLNRNANTHIKNSKNHYFTHWSFSDKSQSKQLLRNLSSNIRKELSKQFFITNSHDNWRQTSNIGLY